MKIFPLGFAHKTKFEKHFSKSSKIGWTPSKKHLSNLFLGNAFVFKTDFFKKDKVKKIVKHFQKNQSDEILFDNPIYYYEGKKYKVFPFYFLKYYH